MVFHSFWIQRPLDLVSGLQRVWTSNCRIWTTPRTGLRRFTTWVCFHRMIHTWARLETWLLENWWVAGMILATQLAPKPGLAQLSQNLFPAVRCSQLRGKAARHFTYASGFCINKFAYLLPTQTSQFLKGFQTWWRTSTSLQATWLPYGTWRMRSGMTKHWSRLWLGTRVNPTMILFSLWGPLLQAVPLLRQNGGPLLQTTQVSVWSWQLLRVWMTSLPLQRFLFDIK